MTNETPKKLVLIAKENHNNSRQKIVELMNEVDNDGFWDFILALVTKFSSRWRI